MDNSVLEIENGIVKKCIDKNVVNVVIPDGVTEIESSAFYDCTKLETIVIPQSVNKIGACCFVNCEKLKSVELPQGITEIHNYTFSGCKSLTSLIIPDSVTKICTGIVGDCISLESLKIGSGVKEIEKKWQFDNCPSLKKIVLADDLEKIDSGLFDALSQDYEIICTEGSKIFKAINRSAKLKVHIKALAAQVQIDTLQKEKQQESVEDFFSKLLADKKDCLFKILAQTKTATVVFVGIACNNVVLKLGTEISKWADKVKKIPSILSDTAKSEKDIYDEILAAKLSLGEIPAKLVSDVSLKHDNNGELRLYSKGRLPAGLNFSDVKCLKLFGITEIDYSAFAKCESIKEVSLPEGVTVINSSAFDRCVSLESVKIPKTVTEIGYRAFSGCSALASVAISDGISKIESCTFGFCSSLSEIVLSDTITEIDFSAFQKCTSLEKVYIPKNVTKIGIEAFGGCTSLSNIEFGGTVEQWKAVVARDRWNKNTPAKCVKCTDGEVALT